MLFGAAVRLILSKLSGSCPPRNIQSAPGQSISFFTPFSGSTNPTLISPLWSGLQWNVLPTPACPLLWRPGHSQKCRICSFNPPDPRTQMSHLLGRCCNHGALHRRCTALPLAGSSRKGKELANHPHRGEIVPQSRRMLFFANPSFAYVPSSGLSVTLC